MRRPEATTWRVLVPYDVREGIDLAGAAKRAGKSPTTIRNWCNQHGLGRRVGVWVVSKVALACTWMAMTRRWRHISLGIDRDHLSNCILIGGRCRYRRTQVLAEIGHWRFQNRL
jgi:hypothetical protein